MHWAGHGLFLLEKDVGVAVLVAVLGFCESHGCLELALELASPYIPLVKVMGVWNWLLELAWNWLSGIGFVVLVKVMGV